MKIEARGLIYDAGKKPDSEKIAFFTGLCRLQSGTILSGFQVGAAKHAANSTVRVCRSRDRGATWQELPCRFETVFDGIPGSLAAGEMVEPEPGRLLLFSTWFDRSDPTKPLFDPVTEGILRSKQIMAVSHDEGDTWSPWHVLQTPGLTGCATTGPAITWPGGTVAYAFESFKEFDDPKPGYHAAWLLISRDAGRTFGKPFLLAQDPRHVVYYWDQRLCPTKQPGEFVALFWTHDLQAKCDLNVHFLKSSINQPITELPRETNIPGQISAPLLLDDGRILSFVVDRSRPGTLKLWQSHDGGATWPETEALTIHEHQEMARLTQGKDNIDFKQYWEDMGKWTFGHPAIRRLEADHALLAYYAGTPERMSIHWTRVKVN